MKYSLLGISVIALISALLLSSCSKEEYEPIPVSSKSCNIEIECVGASGENLIADKSFTDKIKNIRENSVGYVKQLEQLTNFAAPDGQHVFIFITPLNK